MSVGIYDFSQTVSISIARKSIEFVKIFFYDVTYGHFYSDGRAQSQHAKSASIL